MEHCRHQVHLTITMLAAVRQSEYRLGKEMRHLVTCKFPFGSLGPNENDRILPFVRITKYGVNKSTKVTGRSSSSIATGSIGIPLGLPFPFFASFSCFSF